MTWFIPPPKAHLSKMERGDIIETINLMIGKDQSEELIQYETE